MEVFRSENTAIHVHKENENGFTQNISNKGKGKGKGSESELLKVENSKSAAGKSSGRRRVLGDISNNRGSGGAANGGSGKPAGTKTLSQGTSKRAFGVNKANVQAPKRLLASQKPGTVPSPFTVTQAKSVARDRGEDEDEDEDEDKDEDVVDTCMRRSLPSPPPDVGFDLSAGLGRGMRRKRETQNLLDVAPLESPLPIKIPSQSGTEELLLGGLDLHCDFEAAPSLNALAGPALDDEDDLDLDALLDF